VTTRPSSGAPESAAATLGRVDVDARPPLALLGRSGDPESALAFTASHSRGPLLSAALSGLIGARLEGLGLVGAESRAHALGFEVAWLARDAEQAERFIGALHDALETPVRASEPALARARREAQAVRSLPFAGLGDATVAACSGDLGILPGAPEPDLGSAAGLLHLEAARAAVFRAGAAAFAALGPREFLEAAASALASGDDWPTDLPDIDAWPAADVVTAESGSSSRRLSVALRVPDADAAVAAGATLGAPGSDLVARLSAFAPAWSLERSAAIARPRGACLRLDVTPPRAEQGPTASEIGRAAALVESTARAAMERAEPGALDESLLRPADPRRAATLAAWRALEGREKPGPERIAVAYVTDSKDRITSTDVTRAVANARAWIGKRSFEVAERIEAGQGEIWMLLASPCGTGGEARADAGALALALRAVSDGLSTDAVWLEPWVTADGVGLLAHGPRQDPREPAELHARRLARVLGRAFVQRLEGPSVAVARDALGDELGGQPFAGWARALEGLAPDHPSLLEPRGTFASVSAITNDSLERARRQLAQSPLRLSMLANVNPHQVDAAARELDGWLLPFRTEQRACTPLGIIPPRRGVYELGAAEADVREGAYIGAVFDEASPRAARALEITTFLLNRPDGLLEHALSGPKLGATARAHALGGARRPALLIDVRALPQDVPEAVARVRSLLERLAQGGISPGELKLAETELERRDALGRLDPRRRIVELWRGARPAALDLPTLRALHASFRAPAHWIVQVKNAP
jgi:hypothetical protein